MVKPTKSFWKQGPVFSGGFKDSDWKDNTSSGICLGLTQGLMSKPGFGTIPEGPTDLNFQ
jgi:hypothetical protein